MYSVIVIIILNGIPDHGILKASRRDFFLGFNRVLALLISTYSIIIFNLGLDRNFSFFACRDLDPYVFLS